jgi:hypothetical protein
VKSFIEERLPMVKCPFCQFENEDGALFCEQCKSDLGVMEPVASAASEERSAAAAVADPIPEAIPVAAVAEAAAPFAAIAVAETATEDFPFAEAAIPVAMAVAESIPIAVTAEAVPGFALIEAAPPAASSSETAAAPLPPEASSEPAVVTPAAEPVPIAIPVSEGDKFSPDAKPRLVVVRGQRMGVEYPLYEGENYIGRADEKAVDVDLEDQEAADRVWSSRQHAVIFFESGTLTVEDLNSTNGTFVNRLRVHPGQKQQLRLNDVIQVGTVQMRVKA